MRNPTLSQYLTAVSFIFILNGKVLAATSADYANAGLQLYNQKNYAQAIQYYSAAISLDPNNTAALQGRANCYYIQGQYQQALDDYQRVQALAPSPQLSQFIQTLQAKVGTAAPPAAGGQTVGSSFDQGVALYQQKQYAAALPYFQKATQENSNDSKAYYYLGLSYLMLGDNKDATLNLALSNYKQPNPSVEAYVVQLKARLSPEDQQWVDGQLAASNTASSASIAGPKVNKKFGIRLEPAISLFSLNDFNTSAQNIQAYATTVQTYDPTVNYNAHVPTGSANIGFEPVFRIIPNLEFGLSLGVIPVGTADDVLSSVNQATTVTDSYQISGITTGLDLRYLVGNSSFQPFIAAGVLVVPTTINYSYNYTNNWGTATAAGTFGGTGVGGQAQLGLDWHLGDTFVISPFAGYQIASATNFTATVNSTSGGGPPVGSTAVLSMVPVPGYGTVIYPVANGNVVPWGYAAPAGTRPLMVDLGGFKAGLQISAFF